MQVRKWWTQFPKMLVIIGLIAGAYSMYAGDSRRASSVIRAEDTVFYPGPCSTAPKNVGITYKGPLSGCTQINGKACSASEAIEFTAVSSTYAFASCDQFTWVFGDGTSLTTTGTNFTSHQFAAGVPRTVTLTVSNSFGSATATAADVAPNDANNCTPSATQACVNQGRYAVTLDAVTRDSKKFATGQVTRQTDLFAYFSLPVFTGDATNPEVFVKVVGPINGAPLVFYSGLTDVEYFVNVVDTQTRVARQYHVLPASDPTQSKGDFDLNGSSSNSCLAVSRTTSTLPVTGSCTPDTNTLCLFNNRFKLTVSGRDDPARTGKTAQGVATPISGKQFGFFSFPALTNDPTNLEIFVKMIDATSFDKHFWVFFGGLTDFEYTLTVTDTTTGKTQTYLKPLKSLCGFNDTTGFP